MKPLMIELFAGLHGWGEGAVAEGFRVVGFDIVDMCKELGKPRAQGIDLVLQDVLTLHGSQFRKAAVIVASPPCTEFSYRGRYGRKKNLPPPVMGMRLFEACFRIAAEAELPIVVENVVWAQEFVGQAVKHWGSQYLWGDVPALLPIRRHHEFRKGNNAGLASRSAGSRSAKRRQAHDRRAIEDSISPGPTHRENIQTMTKLLILLASGGCMLASQITVYTVISEAQYETHLLGGADEATFVAELFGVPITDPPGFCCFSAIEQPPNWLITATLTIQDAPPAAPPYQPPVVPSTPPATPFVPELPAEPVSSVPEAGTFLLVGIGLAVVKRPRFW